MQTGFLLCLPCLAMSPISTVAGTLAAFLLVNRVICNLLNKDRATIYTSDDVYARALPEHAREQWIFVNGIAVG
jgi:hypothetical protein